ncbi:MAG: AsmA family protein [Magnetococcales bacterium]|nr:AsmA family protein [Magnetococcales bacterium]
MMAKIIKLLLAAVAILVTVVAGLVVAAVFVVDPNDYKEQITQLVQEQTGRRLVIKEKFALSVFPWFGIELGAMELGNAAGFDAGPFATLKSVRARLQLLPLLKQQLVIDTVLVDGLTLHLVRHSSGRNNWDDLVGAGKKSAPAAEKTANAPPAPAAAAGRTAALTSFGIGGVEIRNASLVWDNQITRVRQSLHDISLTTGPLLPGQAVNLVFGCRIESEQPPLAARVRFTTTLTAQPAQQRLLLASSRLELAEDSKQNPQRTLTLQFDADANLATQLLAVTAIKLEGMGLTVTGDIKGRAISTDPKLQANLVLAEFNPQQLLQQLGTTLVTKDGGVLRKASATFKLEAAATEARLTDIQVRLDEALLQGTAGVKAFHKPEIGFDLALNSIDVDRYLPAAAPAAPSSPSRSQESVNSKPPPAPSLQPLRALKMDGKLRIAHLKVAQAQLDDVTMVVRSEAGVIRIQPLTARLYQGQLTSALALNAQSDTPHIELSYTLKQVQAGPLLKDITNVDRISGVAESSATLSAKGLEAKQVTKSLNGQLKFLFADGAVTGVNIPRMIRNAYNTLKGLPMEPEEAVQKTDFTRLEGSVVLTNGVASNQDLTMASPLLRITGQGQADIPADQVDYVVNTALVGTMAGQGGKNLSELNNLTIPIKVSGRLSAPSFGLDLQALLQENLKNQAKQQLQEKIGSKIKDQGIVKGLDKVLPGGVGGLLR